MAKLKDDQKENSKEQEYVKHKNLEKPQLDTKDAYAFCTNRKNLQLCAWLLLVLGLGIAAIMFYLAIKQSGNNDNIFKIDAEVLESHDYSAIFGEMEDELSDISLFAQEVDEKKKNFTTSERLSLAHLYDKIDRSVYRCKETSCQIACANVADIFTALHDIIKNSLCSTIDVLLLDKQNFRSGVLKNNWLPANISFNEVIIRFGKITSIKSAAFNASLFHNTLVLSWYNKYTTNISSGALLGFKRLKYLTIQSYLKEFPPGILQPVERSLLSLKLNGHLKLKGSANIFNGSLLCNLTYLDLSHNIFNGSLSKRFFESTPNLKYLIIKQSQIQHIEQTAFENLANKLLFLNLAKNRLTSLAAGVFEPILMGQYKAVIKLVDNDWFCNCQLKEFADLYKTYNLQFMHILYCKGPHRLYGAALSEIDFRLENCSLQKSLPEENKLLGIKKGETGLRKISTTEYPLPFKLKLLCFDEDLNLSTKHTKNFKRQVRSANEYGLYLEFPAPDYEFDLELIAENNSVCVTIENPDETYLVIWFSEEQESSVVNYAEKNLDYQCMRYALPNIIVGPLQDNTTYTFCVLSSLKNDISPFSCLPLYVPPKSDQSIWIPEDKKHLTIGMLCLIFFLSMLAGAAIAYLGIKSYPVLLEGSKNVLVVKKPDQAYVTTISEIEYLKQSLPKEHKPCTKQQSVKKLPLPKTPPPDTSALSFCMSVKDLERISSVKSATTCVEVLPADYNLTLDEYETPTSCNDDYVMQQRNIENIYCVTPRSPPPLPKRNSNVSNSSTLILSRLSRNQDDL